MAVGHATRTTIFKKFYHLVMGNGELMLVFKFPITHYLSPLNNNQ
ncbi:hypothetical protein [Moorena sp. SIO1F2]|nr:hypothetical protein [Moorena sp. SIO1F2]